MNTVKEMNKTKSKSTMRDVLQRDHRVPEISYQRVSELAYYKAEKRHFEPGHELGDWLEAEKEYLTNNKIMK